MPISLQSANLFASLICEIPSDPQVNQDTLIHILVQHFISKEWVKHRESSTEQRKQLNAAECELIKSILTLSQGSSLAILCAIGAIIGRSPDVIDDYWNGLAPNTNHKASVSLKRDIERWRRDMMEIDEPFRLGLSTDDQMLFVSIRSLLDQSLRELETLPWPTKYEPLWDHTKQSRSIQSAPGSTLNRLDAAPSIFEGKPPVIFLLDKSIFHPDSKQPDPDSVVGCQCVNGDCLKNPEECSCLSFNYADPVSDLPYDKAGKLKSFDSRQAIFECHSACACASKGCGLRVIQNRPHGYLDQLELFHTGRMGWGVRTKVDIPKGEYVGEYVGERVSERLMDIREMVYNQLDLLYSFSLDYGIADGD